jgi:hypothetical protein
VQPAPIGQDRLVTYYIVVRRKYVVFWISKSDDITLPLRQEGMRVRQFFSFKLGDREFRNLNKSTVRVKNKGNVAIQNLSFDVVILGEHTALPGISAKNHRIARSVEVKSEIENRVDPIFAISTPYLNPKEAFEIDLFFDGEADECRVYCRMEDVKIKIKGGDPLFDGHEPTSIVARFVRLMYRRAQSY